MEWSTESIEKVICFVQERPFLLDVLSAELARKFDAGNLCKFLDCVSPPLVLVIGIIAMLVWLIYSYTHVCSVSVSVVWLSTSLPGCCVAECQPVWLLCG